MSIRGALERIHADSVLLCDKWNQEVTPKKGGEGFSLDLLSADNKIPSHRPVRVYGNGNRYHPGHSCDPLCAGSFASCRPRGQVLALAH